MDTTWKGIAGFFGFALINILLIILAIPVSPLLSGLGIAVSTFLWAYTSRGRVIDRSFFWWLLVGVVVFGVFAYLQYIEWF